MTERSLILLFIKAPTSGAVKTRLAADIGAEAAAELSRCFILDMVESLARTGEQVRVCYTPPEDQGSVSQLLPGMELRAQEGADLGERMERAFQQAFSEGYTRALLVGSDIPDLPPALFQAALAELSRNDLVLGPAADGGYYLMGLTRTGFRRELFRAIPWSTPVVRELTLQAAERNSLTTFLLQEWHDVDTLQDLRVLASRNRKSSFTGRTMAYLKKGGRW